MKRTISDAERINNYKTIEEALKAWFSDVWKWERNEFTSFIYKQPGAAICKSNGKYWICLHPLCVNFRKSIGEVVYILTKKPKPVTVDHGTNFRGHGTRSRRS